MRGTRVKIAKDLGEMMKHFLGKDGEAIVDYTYSERYGGENVESYSLVLLNKHGKPYNSCAWYVESQLTLISDDLLAGMEIIENFNLTC